MAKRYEFGYPYAAYMDTSLMRETHTRAEMMAEYKRMRAEAERRLRQLEKYKWTQASSAYQSNVGKFSGGISKLNKTQLAKQMREAAVFLGSQTSTLQGQRIQRDRALDTFREHWGLDFVNRRNIADFMRFLGAAREHFGAANYSMDEVEALFRTARREKLDMDKVQASFAEYKNKLESSKYYDAYLEEAREKFSSEDL